MPGHAKLGSSLHKQYMITVNQTNRDAGKKVVWTLVTYAPCMDAYTNIVTLEVEYKYSACYICDLLYVRNNPKYLDFATLYITIGSARQLN